MHREIRTTDITHFCPDALQESMMDPQVIETCRRANVIYNQLRAGEEVTLPIEKGGMHLGWLLKQRNLAGGYLLYGVAWHLRPTEKMRRALRDEAFGVAAQ